MRSFLLLSLPILAGLALWGALVVIATLDGWFHRPLAPPGDVQGFMNAAIDEIEANYRGNVAFVLIEDRQVFDEHFVSTGD